ncbi:alpha-1,6-glucosidase domain-containing protein, partial [Streptomyces sp. NPDC126497]|uniref:alpha-1,6-glucosidase domain-containing protein n=1 Tax=Streptomyces sp. NPDC126497 TaxID=3155313 RepID=UPI003332E187
DLAVVFNATPEKQEQRVTALAGTGYRLHPVQAAGADRVVRTATYTKSTGTFEVPGRTVAVFAR